MNTNLQDEKEKGMKTFTVSYTGQPWRNRSFKVRGICKFDVLNPCWDNRKDDVPGKHWADEPGFEVPACEACTKAAHAQVQP